jgi:hypothetical protein
MNPDPKETKNTNTNSKKNIKKNKIKITPERVEAADTDRLAPATTVTERNVKPFS